MRIVFRGDSGFCRQRIINYCERADMHYIVGLARNLRLQQITEFLELAMNDEFKLTGIKQREFGEFFYAAQSWATQRRVITRLEYGDAGNNPRYVVTNLQGDAAQLYDGVYCQRGEVENRIKEAQVGLFATRTSCQQFQSNQLRMLLAALAYKLIEQPARFACTLPQVGPAQTSSRTPYISCAHPEPHVVLGPRVDTKKARNPSRGGGGLCPRATDDPRLTLPLSKNRDHTDS